MTDFLLTQYSKGSGCGCKISPSVLKDILHTDIELPPHPNLVVGNESNDDAAVLRIGEGKLLISTTDFFMPIVDDPYDFGRIAATNALSDVYAMGGTPVMALAILGWPIEKLPARVAQRVIEGARLVCSVAGIPLAGGHSVDSPEPLFGLSVNGLVDESNVKTNRGAQVGDLVFLTKPLGSGIISSASKKGKARKEDIDFSVATMCQLNKIGEALGALKSVHALTDITGFGLLGHLIEVCEGSGVSGEIDFSKFPLMPGVEGYLSQFIYPDMTTKNFSTYASKVNQLDANKLFVTCDPQTSGGLLVCIAEDGLSEYIEIVKAFGLSNIADQCIGRITERKEPLVSVL